MEGRRSDDILIERAAPGVHEEAFRLLLSVVSSGDSVIDMGTGQGALAKRIKAAGFHVTAVDINVRDFRLDDDVDYVACNFNDVAEIRQLCNDRREQFGAAVAVEVIEHLENPWEYVRSLTSLVRPGGFVIITTPNPAAWHSRLTFLRRGEFDDFGSRGQEGHVNPIAPWELFRILNECGLRTVQVTHAGDVYESPNVAQRAVRLAARSLRFFQKGDLDGFCLVVLAQRPQ